MGNLSKWFWGIIVLAVIALLVGWFAPAPWGAKANSVNMGKSVQAALNSGEFDWIKSEISGNVVTITGEAPSAEAKNSAIIAAKNAQCEKCSNRENGQRWHVVNGEGVTVKKPFAKVSLQVPYTLSGVLTDGGVVLDGYVRSAKERTELLADAENLFQGKVTDNKLKIAHGAPSIDWYAIGSAHLNGLAALKSGKFMITDTDSFLSGEAETEAVRSAVNSLLTALPTGFNGSSKINVPNVAPVVIGQLKDETGCQDILAELKGDKKINFEFGSAEITGEPSVLLLNAMAAAIRQCSSYSVTVEGHSDASGANEYNLNLSQQRADAVVTYLINKGVNPVNVNGIGFGESRPIASNDTSQGMAANRRIEFIVKKSK